MRTVDEYRNGRPPPSPARAQNLRLLAQESVRIDAVTGDPDWDHFLSYLEAALKITERHIDAEAKKLRNPHLVNDEQIRICKVNLTVLDARAATLKEVIGLPKYLKEQAELAKRQIADMAAGA